MEEELGRLFCRLREKKGISQERLCLGLCSRSRYAFFESGKRSLKKWITDRLFSRLGYDPECFTNNLHRSEYLEAEKKRSIVFELLHSDYGKASKLLDDFETAVSMSDNINLQFIIVIRTQINQDKGLSNQEASRFYRHALSLTAPGITLENYTDYILSVEEIDILTEIMRCEDSDPSFFITLFDSVEKRFDDKNLLAKTLPKIAVYFFKKCFTGNNCHNYQPLIKICTTALEILRDSHRSFYMTESLESLISLYQSTGNNTALLEDYRSWLSALEHIHRLHGVDPHVTSSAYLYIDQNIFCVEDLIEGRRRMNSLSMNGLSNDVCDTRTVSALESGRRRAQNSTLTLLLHELGMPETVYLSKLFTSDTDFRGTIDKAIYEYNNRNFSETLSILDSPPSPENMFDTRKLARLKLLAYRKEHELSKEAFTERILSLLELTVSFNLINSSTVHFLTIEEILCLRNIMMFGTDEYADKALSSLYELTDSNCFVNNIDVFSTIGMAVESKLSVSGSNQYDSALKLTEKLAEAELCHYRLTNAEGLLYDLVWIRQQQGTIESEEFRTAIMLCRELSILNKKNRSVGFFEKKLNELEQVVK